MDSPEVYICDDLSSRDRNIPEAYNVSKTFRCRDEMSTSFSRETTPPRRSHSLRYEERSTAFNQPTTSSEPTDPSIEGFQTAMSELSSNIRCSCSSSGMSRKCTNGCGKPKRSQSATYTKHSGHGILTSRSVPNIHALPSNIEETCIEIASYALEEKLRHFAETELKRINDQIFVLLHGNSPRTRRARTIEEQSSQV